MARDKFRDAYLGVGALGEYEWAIGHETEEPVQRHGNLERSAVTTGVGYVRQQGTPSPTILKYAGWIVKPEQLIKMLQFYNACNGIDPALGPARTVFFTTIDGVEYEVLITEFDAVRQVGKAGGTLLGYVYKYTITMEIIA